MHPLHEIIGKEIEQNLPSGCALIKDKINISGRRSTGKPIQLNSFVSSLQLLFLDKEYSKLSNKDKLSFLKTYWTVIKDLFPQAFDKRLGKEYMLLKSLGVYSLHWLAKDIFQACLKQGDDFRKADTLGSILIQIRSFDWHTKTSPLSALGRMKGASKAHDLLLTALNRKVEIADDKQTLQNYLMDGHSPRA